MSIAGISAYGVYNSPVIEKASKYAITEEYVLSDGTTEEPTVYEEPSHVPEQDGGYSLSEALIQKFSAQFSTAVDLLTKQEEETPTSQERDYIDKMLRHMSSDMVNTGGTWHSSNMTVTQNSINDINEDEMPVRDIPTHFFSSGVPLHDRLHQIATAFTAALDELGSSVIENQQLESAFFHMLRTTHGFSAQLVRINLGDRDAAALDSETIAQMHEDAQRQLELFGETFLAKFKQYGLEDGFSVAWAKLTNPIASTVDIKPVFKNYTSQSDALYMDALEEGVAQVFAEAIAEFRERMLRGNALSEEEIQERIAAFREKFAPEEPATQLELDAFNEKLTAYYLHLRELGTSSIEDLLVFPMLEDDED